MRVLADIACDGELWGGGAYDGGYLAGQGGSVIYSREVRALTGGRDCLIWKTLSQGSGTETSAPSRTGDGTKLGGEHKQDAQEGRAAYVGGEDSYEGWRK